MEAEPGLGRPAIGRGVTILGSANLDTVFSVVAIPLAGETVLAASPEHYPGGKGLNQAVGSARAGAATTFIGAVGVDEAGEILAATMTDAAIATQLLRRVTAATGQAFIVVDRSGENAIVVASGANASVVELSDDDSAAISSAAVLLMQLELPLATVAAAAAVARRSGVIVMLNAAPAAVISAELLAFVDYLVVNEHEACTIAGSSDLAEASVILASQVGRLVVTLGAAGSALFDAGAEIARIDAPQITAVDSTGAGDTYCGAFACAIAEGQRFEQAARFATAAAALSVQALGAVPSVPFRSAIDRALVLP